MLDTARALALRRSTERLYSSLAAGYFAAFNTPTRARNLRYAGRHIINYSPLWRYISNQAILKIDVVLMHEPRCY